MFCTQCGQELGAGAKFCAQCGQETGKSVSAGTTPARKNGLQDFGEMAARAAADSVKSQTRSQISRALGDLFRSIFKR